MPALRRPAKRKEHTMALITCTDASLGYEGAAVVRQLNFTVDPGDYLCVVGENGAGKSTLIKTLLGLTPLLKGSLRFSGGLTQREIGYLPQQNAIQRDFPATVQEIVLSGCLNSIGHRPFFGPAQKQRAKESMERLGILSMRQRPYRSLSGGQQQRVLLARALCATTKLLVLDEPAAGLDPLVSEEMYRLIADLNRDGITVIMVSHDLESVLQYATHILHIRAEVPWFGTREAYANGDAEGTFLSHRGNTHG